MKKIVFFVIILLLVSCVSVDLNVRGEIDSMIMGKVSILFKETQTMVRDHFKGRISEGLKVILINNDTGQKKTLVTDEFGFIKFPNPDKGLYQIKQIVLKKGSSTITFPIQKVFIVPATKDADVYTFGHLNITVSGDYFDKDQVSDIARFKRMFIEAYPDSEWLTTQWIGCKFL